MVLLTGSAGPQASAVIALVDVVDIVVDVVVVCSRFFKSPSFQCNSANAA